LNFCGGPKRRGRKRAGTQRKGVYRSRSQRISRQKQKKLVRGGTQKGKKMLGRKPKLERRVTKGFSNNNEGQRRNTYETSTTWGIKLKGEQRETERNY